MTCSLCPATALRHVNGVGFCGEHAREAVTLASAQGAHGVKPDSGLRLYGRNGRSLERNYNQKRAIPSALARPA